MLLASFCALVTRNHFDRIALCAGISAATSIITIIYTGSLRLRYFDQALAAYAIATIVAAFAVVYRLVVWAQRPPTLMYLKRGWQLLWRRRKNAPLLGKRLLDNFVLQKFIARRSTERWMMHACLSWGSMLAFSLTFPLVFGWIHFETLANDAEVYRVHVFGFPVEEFPIHSMRGLLHFNMLNLAAVLVLVGLVMSLKLRLTDRSEIAVQRFADDVLPLLLLAAVAISGLMLTVSSNLMAGSGFQVIGIAHAASVIGLLLYLPFGKLLHIVQRPLSLAVSFHKDAGRAGSPAACLRCGDDFASQLHVDDLKVVLDRLGFDFRFAVPEGQMHYQDVCPACRRRLFALNQGKAVGR
jgi:nitrate reductase gamma subunit